MRQLLCIAKFNWIFKDSETFPVGVPQFVITGLPGIFPNNL